MVDEAWTAAWAWAAAEGTAPPTPLKSRLSDRRGWWGRVGASTVVRRWIERGVRVKLRERLALFCRPPMKVNEEDREWPREQLAKMAVTGAIEAVLAS